MRLLSEENNLLITNLKDLNTKYNSLVRTHEEKGEELSDVMTRYTDLSKRNKQLELDLEDVRKMKDIFEVRHKNSSEEATKLESQREELMSKLNRCENEIKLQKNQLANQKKTFNELEDKKNNEMELLRKEIDGIKLKEREYANKIVFLERDLDQARDDNRKIKKDLENAKNDSDQMVKLIENYEAKIAHFKKKEEEVARMSKESKERVEEALLQRDRVLLKEEHYHKTIEQLNESHRQEVQSLKDQYDRLLENTRSKTKGNLDLRDQEIKQLNEEVSKLALLNDKLQKELKTIKADYAKVNSSLKDASGTRESRYEEYERRINELEDKLLHTESNSNDRIRALTQEKNSLDSANRQFQNSLSEIRANIETIRAQNSALSAENNSLKAKLGSIQHEKQSFLDEITKIKKSYEAQIAIFEDDYNAKLKQIDNELQESKMRERSTREKTLEMIKTHEKIEQKLKKELDSTAKKVNALLIEKKHI